MTCCKQAQHAATQLDLYKGATKGMLPHASSTSEQRTESTIEVNAPHEDIQTWRQKFDKGCGQIHANDVYIRTCACHGCPCGAGSPKKTTRRRRSLGSSATMPGSQHVKDHYLRRYFEEVPHQQQLPSTQERCMRGQRLSPQRLSATRAGTV